jgi:hypothetical protein
MFGLTIYADSMTGRYPSLFRALLPLVILIVGPLQAQGVFACQLMDEVMRGECCCVGHKSDQDCRDAACDGAVNANPNPCCERSVEVSFDQDARQNPPIVTPLELRFETVLPLAIAATDNGLISPRSGVTIGLDFRRSKLHHSGSDTYLLTQRLRI